VERGFEVHVVSTAFDNRGRRVARVGLSVEDGVFVHRLGSWFRLGYASVLRGLRSVLGGLRPDVVHAHNLHPHLFQAARWRGALGYGLVAQLHCPVVASFDHLSARVLYKFAMWELVRMQGGVDVFVAHTELERRWLVEEGVEAWRVRVIRFPGVPDEVVGYRPGFDVHERLGADVVVSHVGRLHPRKGQHLLVEAAYYLRRFLEDFKVYIVGPPSDLGYYRRVHRLVEKLGLEKWVVFDARAVPEGEKLDIIASSDVFTYTPLRDYTPVALLEAVGLGVPVVATRVGGIPEMAESLGVESVVVVDPSGADVARGVVEALGRGGVPLEALRPHLVSSLVGELARLYAELVR